VVEKRCLAVFTATCALGLALAVGLDLFQLHMHGVIPCLCSLPTEPSPEGLQLEDFMFVQTWVVVKKNDPKKPPGYFLKGPVKKTTKPTKNPTFYFFLKKSTEK